MVYLIPLTNSRNDTIIENVEWKSTTKGEQEWEEYDYERTSQGLLLLIKLFIFYKVVDPWIHLCAKTTESQMHIYYQQVSTQGTHRSTSKTR